jgi:hypothetical protein
MNLLPSGDAASILRRLAIAIALPLGLALPAHASNYVNAGWSGEVMAVNADAPVSLTVGTPIYFDAFYDLDKLVDYTMSVNDATGLGFSSVLSASLSDDPKDSLSVSVGSISYDKYDQLNYGTPEGDAGPGGNLGIGDFPEVAYLNGSFAGFGNILINSAGYTIDADPIADAFGGFDLGDGDGGYDFVISKGTADDPFADILAVGDYNASAAAFSSAAPEPSTWALLLAGIGGIGMMFRGTKKVSGLRMNTISAALTLPPTGVVMRPGIVHGPLCVAPENWLC